MTTSREYGDFLEDILTASEKAESFIRGMSYEAFQKDDKTAYAEWFGLWRSLAKLQNTSLKKFGRNVRMFRGEQWPGFEIS